MNTNTTRRALIQAAPAAAVALAIPASAASLPADRSGFDALIRAWEEACAQQNRAALAHHDAEAAFAPYRADQPTKTIRYPVPGFTSDNGLVSMKAHRETITLRPHHARRADEPYSQLPEFLDYRREVETWETKTAPFAKAFKDADKAFGRTVEEANAAWRNLAAYPVATIEQLHEKMEQCRADAECEDTMDDLLDFIAADLARLAGEA